MNKPLQNRIGALEAKFNKRASFVVFLWGRRGEPRRRFAIVDASIEIDRLDSESDELFRARVLREIGATPQTMVVNLRDINEDGGEE